MAFLELLVVAAGDRPERAKVVGEVLFSRTVALLFELLGVCRILDVLAAPVAAGVGGERLAFQPPVDLDALGVDAQGEPFAAVPGRDAVGVGFKFNPAVFLHAHLPDDGAVVGLRAKEPQSALFLLLEALAGSLPGAPMHALIGHLVAPPVGGGL